MAEKEVRKDNLETEIHAGKDEKEDVKMEEVFSSIVSNGKQMSIPFELLDPSPFNTFEVQDVEELVDSIRIYGLLTPLSVIGPLDNGHYSILCGERRYLAIKKIKENYSAEMFNEVPSYVVGDKNMDVVSQQLIIEINNIDTRDFNKEDHRFQVVRLLKEMEEHGTIDQKKMVAIAAKKLSIHPRYSRMYFSIFKKGSEKTIEAVKNKDIPVHLASNIAQMPKDDQDALLESTDVMESVKKREIKLPEATDIAKRPEKEKASIMEAIHGGIKPTDALWAADEIKKEYVQKKVAEKESTISEDAEPQPSVIANDELKVVNETLSETAESGNNKKDDEGKTSDKKSKSKKPLQLSTPEDYETAKAIESLLEDDDYDLPEDMNVLDYMLQNTERVPLNLDTTGIFNSKLQADDEKESSTAIRKAIAVIEKLKRKTEFTEEEEELFDVMRDVLNYRDSLCA